MKALLGYVGIGLIKLLGTIPFPMAQAFGKGIGWFSLIRRTRVREVARVNLKLAYPEMPDAERDQLLRNTLLESGKTLGEMGPMWGYESERGYQLIKRVHNEHLFDELIAGDHGSLLLAPHLGNWELINNYVAQKCPITIMYRPAKSPTFNRWMVARREKVGCKLVPTTRDGVMSLFSTLENNELVGFLPDQEPRPKSGVFAPFMGTPALTPKLPHEMLTKTGAKALYVFAQRLPDAQGFELYFIKPEDDLYSDDVEVSAASMNRGIAECVAHCTEQYQWTYKRFKRQPDGEPNPYSVANVP